MSRFSWLLLGYDRRRALTKGRVIDFVERVGAEFDHFFGRRMYY